MLNSSQIREAIGKAVYQYMLSPHAGLERLAREIKKFIDAQCQEAGGIMEGGKRISSHDKELLWLQGVEYGLQLLEVDKFSHKTVARRKEG